MTGGWIGVDLDGTLAHYPPPGDAFIGPPIPAMLERVRAWLAAGRDVRIFTARVDGAVVAAKLNHPETARYQDVDGVRAEIEAWCRKHIGRVLPITNVKDYGMEVLYDDRCRQVMFNTGVVFWNHPLATHLGLLDRDELRVIEAIAARLAKGRGIYGPLVIAKDGRNFDSELRDELLDGLVYGAAAILREQAKQDAIPTEPANPAPVRVTSAPGKSTCKHCRKLIFLGDYIVGEPPDASHEVCAAVNAVAPGHFGTTEA